MLVMIMMWIIIIVITIIIIMVITIFVVLISSTFHQSPRDIRSIVLDHTSSSFRQRTIIIYILNTLYKDRPSSSNSNQ